MMPNVLIAPIQEALSSLPTYSKIGVLVDENTLQHCYPAVESWLPPHNYFQIRSGEEHKNLNTAQDIWQWLTDQQFDRKSLLINLGGGVIGDMGGFCAATFKRGIAFVQVPTTLLAQVDASVGGKLGIDFNGFKNHIGVFEQPAKVLIDTTFLKTLPDNELVSGFAEIVKHCLIADAAAWQKLQSYNPKQLEWHEWVKHSVGIKSHIVSQDTQETGLRKILNFGHTIGHAIEGFLLENKRKILHGEGVAAGMIAENYLAVQKGMLLQSEHEHIESYLRAHFPTVYFAENEISAIAQYAFQDKKNNNGQILASLLNGIGQCRYDIPLSVQEVENALHDYL